MGSLGGESVVVNPELNGEAKVVTDVQSGGASLKQGEGKDDAPKIHYFARPNSTTLSTVVVIFLYHMLPFTALPNIGLLYFPFSLYKRSEYVKLTLYLGLMLVLVVMPPHYSKTLRRKVRWLYEELAVYLPSAKFVIVPQEPLPQGKGYIFAIHPHGRMFYSNAMFSQLHEIWRAPLGLTHGTNLFLKLHSVLKFLRYECS